MKSDHVNYKRRFVDREKGVSLNTNKYDTFTPPLYVESAGSSQWGQGHCFKRKCSEVFSVEYVISGNAELIQDGVANLIGPGEVFILRNGCNHEYKTGPAGFLHKRFLNLAGPMLDPLLQMTGLWGIDHIKPISSNLISWHEKKILKVLKEKKGNFILELSSLAFGLMLELARSMQPEYPFAVKSAIEFISQNLTKTISIKDICTHVGLSQTHFNRLFKQHIKMSPISFFLEQRFAWARYLLSNTTMSIKEIAQTVGYDNPLYFSAQFKKNSGVSPKYFKKSIK